MSRCRQSILALVPRSECPRPHGLATPDMRRAAIASATPGGASAGCTGTGGDGHDLYRGPVARISDNCFWAGSAELLEQNALWQVGCDLGGAPVDVCVNDSASNRISVTSGDESDNGEML